MKRLGWIGFNLADAISSYVLASRASLLEIPSCIPSRCLGSNVFCTMGIEFGGVSGISGVARSIQQELGPEHGHCDIVNGRCVRVLFQRLPKARAKVFSPPPRPSEELRWCSTDIWSVLQPLCHRCLSLMNALKSVEEGNSIRSPLDG